MATSFGRSVRSLQAQDSRITLIGLVLTTVLLSSWLVWFFFARLSLYAVSDPLTIAPAETLQATFPAAHAGRIIPGQPARLILTGTSRTEAHSIPALVYETAPQANGRIRAAIYVDWAQSSLNSIPQCASARVQVETEQVSPARLFLRAAGESAAASTLTP